MITVTLDPSPYHDRWSVQQMLGLWDSLLLLKRGVDGRGGEQVAYVMSSLTTQSRTSSLCWLDGISALSVHFVEQ